MKISKSCPDTLAAELFSRNVIPAEVLDQVVTGQDSGAKKASIVLVSVCSQVQANPEKLLDFIEALKEEASFDEIVKAMIGK